MSTHDEWPDLDWNRFQDTWATLQRWTQIVGKVRLRQTPWVNHGWNVTLYPTARGLTTSPIPHGRRMFQIDFDFIAHQLDVTTSSGGRAAIELRPRSVADFHRELLATLDELHVPVRIDCTPNEQEDGTRLDEDTIHASYDAAAAAAWWRILGQAHRVFQIFRSHFIGKCSPIHFFWGGGDLAVSRFSGRAAPVHPGGIPNLPDRITREAYSHEVCSAGFWPGGGGVESASFYSYVYPAPPGYEGARVRPAEAYFHPTLREYVLPYDAVRAAADPDHVLLEFLQSTYEAAAELAQWDRAALERHETPWRRPRPRGNEPERQ